MSSMRDICIVQLVQSMAAVCCGDNPAIETYGVESVPVVSGSDDIPGIDTYG
jgi:hypothetical protein